MWSPLDPQESAPAGVPPSAAGGNAEALTGTTDAGISTHDQRDAMFTSWGEALAQRALGEVVPLPEHPRPQLRREKWQSLNGAWQYAVQPLMADAAEPTAVDDPTAEPRSWDGQILVPFSPEFPLSRTPLFQAGAYVQPDQTLWYRRDFDADYQDDQRVLLHFGAVDQSCRVAVNGIEVGGNTGGYLPFTLDVTDALAAPGQPNALTVAVRDVTDSSYMSRGKQSLNRGGIWYTPQSGIWQSVWLETVPRQHIERLDLVPAMDSIEVTVVTDQSTEATVKIGLPVPGPRFGESAQIDEPLLERTIPTDAPSSIPIPDPKLWTPEDPWLYPMEVRLPGGDRVSSYFALRTLGIGKRGDGKPALLLNGRPYFAAGLLDQGYWPDGGYTAPSDDALVWDIETAKAMGYNMLRKHIKVEPMRWYHHCDRLGMLVWQDAVNGGRPPKESLLRSRVILPYWLADRPGAMLGRQDPEGLVLFQSELERMITALRSVPSVAMWVPFNEGWGQFNAEATAAWVGKLDPSRPVDHASGWFDQGAGDLHSVHLYFRPPTMVGRGLPDRRVLALTEYGGLALPVPGHTWNSSHFGYQTYDDPEDLSRAFAKLHGEQIPPVVDRGLAATVYTQLADVEDEINGLVTYDRRVTKIDQSQVRELNLGFRTRAAT